MLEQRGLLVERQKSAPIRNQNVELDDVGQLDLPVDDQLMVKLKPVENIHPVHSYVSSGLRVRIYGAQEAKFVAGGPIAETRRYAASARRVADRTSATDSRP